MDAMSMDFMFWTGGVVVGAAGLALMGWALFADRSRGRRRCPKCWYDMRSIAGQRCPECGRIAKSEKKLFKTRRRWSWVMTSLAVFVLAAFLAIQPKVQRDGWGSVMPATVLILAMRSNDNQWAWEALDARTTTHVSHPHFDGTWTMPDASSLFAWQWRIVADACVGLLHEDPGDAEKIQLLEWMSRCSVGLEDPDAKRVFDEMNTLLTDGSARVREMAAIYCASNRYPELSVEVIRPLLDDTDQSVRIAAVSGLRILGRHNLAPLQTLLDALNHEDWEVRSYAAAALGSMAQYGPKPLPDEVFETLLAAYQNDQHHEVRKRALQAICQFPDERDRAFSLVQQAVLSSELSRREAGYQQLLSTEFDERFTLESMLRGVFDESADVRSSSVWLLLNRFEPDVLRPHLEWLRSLTTHDDEELRSAALWQLARLGESTDAVSDSP